MFVLDSLKTLKDCGFRVRAIASDNHSANGLAYKLLLKEFGHLDYNLFISTITKKSTCFMMLHLKVVKFLGNYFTMFLENIACLRLT